MLTRCLTVSLLLIVILTALSDAAEFATMPNRRKAKPKVEPPKVEEKVEVEEPPPLPPPLPPPEPIIIESVLPEPVIEQNLDPHVKIVIHSAPWCTVCPAAIAEAEKLKDEYEVVVVEEHENGFQTSYGYYIDSFPYIEYYYDGKVKLYNYGKRTEEQLRRTIKSLSK